MKDTLAHNSIEIELKSVQQITGGTDIIRFSRHVISPALLYFTMRRKRPERRRCVGCLECDAHIIKDCVNACTRCTCVTRL